MSSIPEHIAEVTLIGTGGGYGESCVIHLCDNNWIVIDSCIDPFTNESLPLKYLLDNNVNIECDVKLVVCTHWHDDHILGLSQILSRAKSCDFIMARAHDRQKFLSFVSLDYEKAIYGHLLSSTLEFVNCLQIIEREGINIVLAGENKILFSNKRSSLCSQVISLSPSDYVIMEFDKEISTMITEFGVTNKKVVIKKPNPKSVALYLKLGDHRVLLGSDLEYSNDPRTGWLNIIEYNNVIDKKSNLFKVPHHGSINAFHDRIWIDLLDKNAIFCLTPFNKGKPLPEENMVDKMLDFTDSLFITSMIKANSKSKKRSNRSIEKMIEKNRPSLTEIKYSYGAINCQVDLTDPTSRWSVTTLGEGLKYKN